MNAIQTTNLTKLYGSARGISAVNISVAEGDIFGFIGSNGAGKSTTVKILLGLLRATSGSAMLFGRDVAAERLENLSEVGYMPGEVNFYPEMTAGEIIRFSAALRKTDCSAEAKTLCERFGVETDKKIRELSLGNRKKVSLVCAAQHKPRLYILDEPTSGLDPLMQQEFFALLAERHAAGATVFLSSHVLSEIRRCCRTAAIIREGRIVACDKVEKIMSGSTRRARLHFRQTENAAAAAETLGSISEVTGLRLSANELSFLYAGEVNKLISLLSSMTLSDITVTEPDPEEVLMHFYKD